MQRPPLFSEVAARYGLQLLNCDDELSRRRYVDNVLILDTNPAPWKEFFVRANVLTPDADWRMFVMDYRNYFSVVIYGNNRLPTWVLPPLLKSDGVIVNIKDDCYYRLDQLFD